MKRFSTIINEDKIVVPQFNHPQLSAPNDADGKFWVLIAAANTSSDKASKNAYAKVIKLSKDLYAALVDLADPELTEVQNSVGDLVKKIETASSDTTEELSNADVKQLKTYLFILANIDAWAKNKNWYKGSKVDVKAGYVPLRGSAKDPKIKYRMVVVPSGPVSEATVKEINKNIMGMSPIHSDYVAGIEWAKDRTKFQILLTSTAGYKR